MWLSQWLRNHTFPTSKNDTRVIWWDVKDGGDTTLENMTAKYNEIEGLVRKLIATLHTHTADYTFD